MRWDELFDDLESQLEHELTAEDLDLEAEQERLRLGRLSVRDRLAAIHDSEPRHSGYRITLVLGRGRRLTVRPLTYGRDWLSGDLIDDSPHARQCIVPLTAITGVTIGPAHVRASLGPAGDADAPSSLPSRLGIPFVLRDLCRRRRALDVVLDGGELHGTIDRVGRDHLDLAVHEPGSPRREGSVRELRLVPLDALQFVRL
jgi:hypothetical protein